MVKLMSMVGDVRECSKIWGVRAFWRVGGCIQDVSVRSRTHIDEHVRDWVECGM